VSVLPNNSEPSLTINKGAFCIYGSYLIHSVNGVNQLIFVMVKRGVLFEVRTEVKYYLDELRLQRVKHH
jgi:hypothetical protein